MLDFLSEYLLGEDPEFDYVGLPMFRDNFKVTIVVEKIKGDKN